MKSKHRRLFIISAAATTAGASALDVAAQGTAPAGITVGKRMDQWSAEIQPHLKKLPDDKLQSLLKANGASDSDELALTWAKRYPTIKPKDAIASKVPRLGDYLKAGRDGEPSYEKGPSHDKEPYDKGAGYDKMGFSRT